MRVALEDMNVRIDHSVAWGFGGESRKCERASGGLGEKAAAGEYGRIQCFSEVPTCSS